LLSLVRNRSESFAFNQRFPGQYFNSETGKHYNYFRDYDPALGRYVESDLVGLRGGLNTYSYVLSNPLARFDSNGLMSITIALGHGAMLVDPERPGQGAYFVPISSGQGKCINQPKCEAESNRGPVPRGDYTIDPNELDDPGPLHDLVRQFRGDWGDWRVPLKPSPGTSQFGRSGFKLHGGMLPGSAGCVDVGGGVFGNSLTDRLKNDIRNSGGPIRVRVH
jgi:RHS repeat-associated protein